MEMQHVDLSLLDELMNHDKALVAQFIEIFKSQAPALLRELKNHITTEDWPSASITAHGIKSQLKYFKAEHAVSLAFAIEKMAEDEQRLQDLSGTIEALDAEVMKICESL